MDRLRIWMSVCAGAVVLAGGVIAFVDLTILPVKGNAVLPWATGMLGATMMGWGLTVFSVARYALRTRSADLLKGILLGIAVWFVVDTGFSAFLGVYFNCLVNIVILAALGYPLAVALRQMGTNGGVATRRLKAIKAAS